MPFIDALNPAQKEAATSGDGPLLILAGAGSGKTRVLAARIAFLVDRRGVPPSSILAVTFTNKAAGEMRERLHKLIGPAAKSLWLGTFHSLGLRILRAELRRGGASHDITVYNDDDQLALIKQVMAELEISDKTLPPKNVLAGINHAKNDALGPSDVISGARNFIAERMAKIYALYQKRLREMNCMDFGDLICEPIRLWRSDPQRREAWQGHFQHVLVDEYQDTNRAQYVFTNLLAAGTRNIMAVGDPDQSIYGWRGADIRNILDFERDYADATVLRLEENYRSTKMILGAANAVIEKNKGRLKKTLWTANADGEPLQYEEADDEYAEVRGVLKRLKAMRDARPGLGYRDFAVFYRTNAQSRVFEEELIRGGIPYTIVGGVRFYDRKEIRDAIAYLRCVTNPNDAISLQRVVNTPPRGIGKATFDKVRALSAEAGLPLLDAFSEAHSRGFLRKNEIRNFIEAFEAFRADSGTAPLHELALRLLEDSGYLLMWQSEGTDDGAERVENIFEFISAIKDFEAAFNAEHGADGGKAAISDFLDHVALISDVDAYEEDADRLTLMTIHSAKGLEFKTVFITGMEEGLFPHARSLDEPDALEEERRLCYVGMTRAKERLFLSSAKTRSMYGETKYRMRSRFVEEVPPECMETVEPEPEERRVYTYEEKWSNQLNSGAQAKKEPVYEDNSSDPWRIGVKVRHPTFGLGVIKEKTGSGPGAKVTVSFKDAGLKKLALRYAILEVVG
ncbi:MAG: UvrD-helicase domain-containing protein [Deltaproteobacteria bacterium]|nr:UvrD-helicase domain-containing protein [Deltaproteobacteria bacterium]